MKAKIFLSYQSDKLWWSSDEVSWSEVGPNSPQTLVGPNDKIEWNADSSIDEIGIDLDNDNIIDEPISGSGKVKTGKIKSKAKNGARTKYSVIVKIGKDSFTIDPDIKVCDPKPCKPSN